MSGTQQQQASGQLDSLAREATGEEGGEGPGGSDSDAGGVGQARAKRSSTKRGCRARQAGGGPAAAVRRSLATGEGYAEYGARVAPNQPGAASKLRDALNGMDQSDLGNRVQRTADWLREGSIPTRMGRRGDWEGAEAARRTGPSGATGHGAGQGKARASRPRRWGRSNGCGSDRT